MTTPFLQRHLDFVERLSSNPNLLVPVSSQTMAQKGDSTAVDWSRFPEPVAEMYGALEGLRVKWKLSSTASGIRFLDEEEDFVEGELCLVPRAEFLEGLDVDAVEEEFGLAVDASLRGALHPFERVDGDYVVCMHAQRPDELIYLDLDGGEQHRIPLGLSAYFDQGYRDAFFYGWQKARFFADERCQQTLDHYLPQLFPEG